MEILDLWTTELEVIDSKTERYSSTSVSGGGGFISTSPDVPSRLNNITSETTHHRSQSFWFRDVEDGKEHHLELEEVNFPVRPGQRVLVIGNGDNLERLHNLHTGQTCTVPDESEFHSGTIKDPLMQRFGLAFLTVLGMLPILGWIFGISLLIDGKSHDTKSSSGLHRLITIVSFYALSLPLFVGVWMESWGLVGLLYVLAIFWFWVMYWGRLKRGNNLRIANCAKIETWLAEEISKRKIIPSASTSPSPSIQQAMAVG